MASRPVVQVEGARQLRRTLKQAGLDVQDLKDAHKQVADMVAQRSHPRAPRRTGALDASVRASGTQSAAIVRAGRKAVPYAGPIHFGWPAHHITAQPWITQTAEATQDTWEGMYLAAIEAVLDKVEGTSTR